MKNTEFKVRIKYIVIASIFLVSIFQFFYSNESYSGSPDDEMYQDAIEALNIFDHNFSQGGMVKISIETIPSCYKNTGNNYRKVRVCAMLDFWASDVDQQFRKLMKEKYKFEQPETKGISIKESLSRYRNALSKLDKGDIDKMGDRWVEYLNKAYKLSNRKTN